MSWNDQRFDAAPENALATERMAVEDFAVFLGDEPGDGAPFVEPS